MKRKSVTALLLALAVLAGLLAGCTQQEAQGSPAPAPTAAQEQGTGESPAPSETTSAAERPQVRLAMLSGPTGMGAAKLIADSDAGTTLNDYTVELAAQPTELQAKLINGDLDIAALPTNVASVLYNKTEGGVQLLALNTLGVLYILENGERVNSMADLRGRTIYATGQGANPEYVLNYLLEQNGLDPASDVTIEWRSTGDEVAALMASGEAELAMLPVPAATAVLKQNSDVRAAIDLNDAWEASGAAGTFTMGCVVVRTEFAQENPQAVENFLTEYAASIDYVKNNQEEAAALIAQYGITPSEQIALAAIPQANLVCITGLDMLDIQSYYEVLFQADPKSIGGSIPDSAFYYGVEG